MPAKIGVVPSTSPTVEALVRCAEVTNDTWLRKIIAAAISTNRKSRRSIRNDRSRHQV